MSIVDGYDLSGAKYYICASRGPTKFHTLSIRMRFDRDIQTLTSNLN